jgi:hypothetical protein
VRNPKRKLIKEYYHYIPHQSQQLASCKEIDNLR